MDAIHQQKHVRIIHTHYEHTVVKGVEYSQRIVDAVEEQST